PEGEPQATLPPFALALEHAARASRARARGAANSRRLNHQGMRSSFRSGRSHDAPTRFWGSASGGPVNRKRYGRPSAAPQPLSIRRGGSGCPVARPRRRKGYRAEAGGVNEGGASPDQQHGAGSML